MRVIRAQTVPNALFGYLPSQLMKDKSAWTPYSHQTIVTRSLVDTPQGKRVIAVNARCHGWSGDHVRGQLCLCSRSYHSGPTLFAHRLPAFGAVLLLRRSLQIGCDERSTDGLRPRACFSTGHHLPDIRFYLGLSYIVSEFIRPQAGRRYLSTILCRRNGINGRVLAEIFFIGHTLPQPPYN